MFVIPAASYLPSPEGSVVVLKMIGPYLNSHNLNHSGVGKTLAA